MAEIDVSELVTLAVELRAAGKTLPAAAYTVTAKHTAALGVTWRRNARQSAGAHGRLYPASITSTTRTVGKVIEGEVGPDPSRPQGAMGPGFEFGSVNQPPHLDGQRALDVQSPLFLRDIAKLGFDA